MMSTEQITVTWLRVDEQEQTAFEEVRLPTLRRAIERSQEASGERGFIVGQILRGDGRVIANFAPDAIRFNRI